MPYDPKEMTNQQLVNMETDVDLARFLCLGLLSSSGIT